MTPAGESVSEIFDRACRVFLKDLGEEYTDHCSILIVTKVIDSKLAIVEAYNLMAGREAITAALQGMVSEQQKEFLERGDA